MAIQVDEREGEPAACRVHGPEVTANGLQVAKLLALCASLICPASSFSPSPVKVKSRCFDLIYCCIHLRAHKIQKNKGGHHLLRLLDIFLSSFSLRYILDICMYISSCCLPQKGNILLVCLYLSSPLSLSLPLYFDCFSTLPHFEVTQRLVHFLLRRSRTI